MEHLAPPIFEGSELGLGTVRHVLGETILNIQDKVAVYDGDKSIPVCTSGKLYITSHQLYFIHSSAEILPFQLSLDRVKTVTSVTGTLTASPKIRVEFIKKPANCLNSSWICSICYHKNWDTTNMSCAACGTRNDLRVIKDQSSNDSPQTIACPACTFENHRLLLSCEVCETPLFSSQGVSQIIDSFEEDADAPESTVFIRFSFRGGGHSQALKALQNAVATEAWKVVDRPLAIEDTSKAISSRGGIQGLVEKVERNAFMTNQQLGEAFQDLQALMDRAAQMVQLASTIAAKLQKMSSHSASLSESSDNALIKNCLVQLGIDSPVTKDAAGSLFHCELAKEIGKAIIPILSQPPYMGAIDLLDVYCIFNRARGVGNFVSPADVLKCCNSFDEVAVPLTLKHFPSGLNVLQTKSFSDEMILRKIVKELETEPNGLDITGLSDRLGHGMSLELLKYYLQLAEDRGLICRDSAPPLEILFYFPASPFYV